MTTPRDEIWIDMTQFDTDLADGIWDGATTVPDAPRWYDDVTTLVHTARGPAEPGELIDEPLVVENMHRTTLGAWTVAVRRRPAKALGQLLAMKAAAATTASVVSVAAAAAATTGIVATVATVVVPVIQEHVVPRFTPSDEGSAPAPVSASASSPLTSSPRNQGQLACTVYGESCLIDLSPAAPAPPPADGSAATSIPPVAAGPEAVLPPDAPVEAAAEAPPEVTPPPDTPAESPPSDPPAAPGDTEPRGADPRRTDPRRTDDGDPGRPPPEDPRSPPAGDDHARPHPAAPASPTDPVRPAHPATAADAIGPVGPLGPPAATKPAQARVGSNPVGR